ncbi:MAG: BREX-1 system adenine-specific DNA-methyltransferase PglX, partial [Bacteriovorax sp.]
MDTSVLKNFAQESRRYLMDVVTKKMEYFLTLDNVEIRAKKHLIEDLKNEISNTSKDLVIEKIAYTWFNRFCALRYMDVKQYSLVGVLTPVSESHTQPEILMEAKSGHIKDELGNLSSRDHVIGLLSGKISSNDPQSEAYKHLVLMSCNYYHSIMPFLFEKIDDYTELLMPDDLLSEASIISKVRNALSEENCKDVEVIGWLYQFYISEKKDEVFEGLKKNKKITPENIPAATQLFTPDWIVRYLVENSLGRLWMLNRPNSNLISKMEYYIKPDSEEKEFLKIKGPEEIKVCDPACGSGHMLVYAFDLLYLMYEEEGIDSNEIPSLILKNNLFGIEIDKRAGELAAFALTMKAREKQRRYFRNPVSPNICVLENIHFEEAEIKDYLDHVGHDLFSSQLRNTLTQFAEAKNFGSLIRPEVSDVQNILNLLDKKSVSGHLFLTQTHTKVLKVLSQVKLLFPVYHVVIANPPYKGKGDLNKSLQDFMEKEFPDSKGDLFACFIERTLELVKSKGFNALVVMQAWLFIDSYKELREKIILKNSFENLIQIGFNSFPELNSKFALAAAHVIRKDIYDIIGNYISLNHANRNSDKKSVFFEAKQKNQLHKVKSSSFK